MAGLLGLIEKERREPGDGLIGSLIRSHGDAIDDRELAGLADGVLTGGLETSASMIALGAYALMTDAGLRARISEGDDVLVVEELLRYLTVVQVAFPRVATRDHVIAGTPIRTSSASTPCRCTWNSRNRPAQGCAGRFQKITSA